MKLYCIVEIEIGSTEWTPVFSDPDRAVVRQELRDMKDSDYGTTGKLKIITTYS